VIAVVDSSVLLRKLFGEKNSLAEWPRIVEAYASRLLPVEIARVIERARLMQRIDDDQVGELHSEYRRAARSIEILALTESILVRATMPMPVIVGSLDAIHLATALALADTLAETPVLATHDEQLARAARAFGLPVIGV
jgi:predicted nucleic acid-binding protein